MKLVYSRRPLADLEEIAAYSSTNASPTIAAAVEHRVREVIGRIRTAPEAGPRVAQRSNVRAIAVVRYPYRIFYRVRGDAIDILHIRHTSRRPLAPSNKDSDAHLLGCPQGDGAATLLRGPAAVDRVVGPGDLGCIVAAQEQCQRSNLL